MDPELMNSPEGTTAPADEEVQASEARKKLVEKWTSTVKADKLHWGPAFDRMKKCRDFAFGRQWSENDKDDRYRANITQRHVQQRVAALYAKNPKTVARLRDRLLTTVWDGSMSSVQASLEQVMLLSGTPGGLMSPEFAKAMATLEEAQRVTEERKMIEKFGRTLELLYDHNVDEQIHPFKAMMKLVVRRAVTTSVGYVKLGFQRAMGMDPGIERQLADAAQRLATVERLAEQIGKGDMSDPQDPELERLRLLVQDLQNTPEIIVREGLSFDYPDSCAIIPDRGTTQLREFLGADHVTEEFVLTPAQVKEIYGKDVSKQFTRYRPDTKGKLQNMGTSLGDGDIDETDKCLVWQTYCKTDGMVYETCDGYEDFLREPAAPETWTERFWPWYPLVLNELDHPGEVYPPSDVWLMMDQQREYNRRREGSREHRKQNRPLTVSPTGTLSDDDKAVLQNRPAFAHIELDGLMPGQKVGDLLQPMQFSGVDPNLYEVGEVFDDVLRVVGVQEANLGASAGDTATETAIAESSRMSSLQSSIDELDDMLSQLARQGGMILLDNVSPQTVKEIVGPAAVWPTMRRGELAKEIFLEIEAGSTGRPNQAQEIQNFERMAPLVMQIPGIKPEKLAKEAIRRLDDRLRLEDMYDENLPSITALNQIMGAAPGGPQQTAGANAPAEQGAQGAGNAPRPSRVAGAPGGPDLQPQQPPGMVQ